MRVMSEEKLQKLAKFIKQYARENHDNLLQRCAAIYGIYGNGQVDRVSAYLRA